MRIAFIINEFPTLSETFILNQITGLIDRGHDVDIYADRPREAERVHPDIESYKLLERTHYFNRPNNRLLRLLKGLTLLLSNFFINPRVTLQSINVFRFGRPAATLMLLFAITPFLQVHSDYDIVHCHFGPNGIKGMLLIEAGALQGKLITTFHGFDISRYIKQHGERVYKDLFAKGDLFFAISERMRQQLIDAGCDTEKVKVHRVGINVDTFSFTTRQLQKNHTIQILTIARLTEKKGLEYGIRAVSKLTKIESNVKYFIVGDGSLRNDLSNLIKELNMGNVIKLLGWKEQQEIVELLKNTDIFLAPSVTAKDGDQEGIPVVLMEAMAQGIPLVSTLHSGIPELVKDGVSGLLAQEGDATDLFCKLHHLIKHSEIWSDMGLAGRLEIEKYYNLEKLNDQLVITYQDLNKSFSKNKIFLDISYIP